MDFKNASVAICGLGGLGSNISVMLARSGVGYLKLIDFDNVERSNLNRQTYFEKHIGMPKTEALANQLHEIGSCTVFDCVNVKITAENAAELIADCDIICEAFDDPNSKAMLTELVLTSFPDKKLVCGSGMAGLGSANDIVTRKINDRFYICGDGKSESDQKNAYFAPRVIACAAHQANMILNLIRQQRAKTD